LTIADRTEHFSGRGVQLECVVVFSGLEQDARTKKPRGRYFIDQFAFAGHDKFGGLESSYGCLECGGQSMRVSDFLPRSTLQIGQRRRWISPGRKRGSNP